MKEFPSESHIWFKILTKTSISYENQNRSSFKRFMTLSWYIMTQNDINTKQKFLDLLLKEQSKELGLSDIIQIQEKFNDPLILSVILHQLIEERKKTNQILAGLNEKYDQLQFLVKNQLKEKKESDTFNILSEVDDKIISFVRSKEKVDASMIQEEFKYKGSNAASQRLNKLVKDKYLNKIQAGRKVYFIIRWF